ncbi:interferon alpha-inducible protein 27-like protein 2A [Lepisosteus oculatus]|uniref:interferon alpha-inducible protein 27-like protein 2A n=1 Tax=Lepisosteus oculatus TaxID=7918 RepID=UPI003719897C
MSQKTYALLLAAMICSAAVAKEEKSRWSWTDIGIAAAGGVVAVAVAPVALGAAGFTSAGIAAGSLAAQMMSSAAIANGGGVALGGVVAALQSAGTGIAVYKTAAAGAAATYAAKKYLEGDE